MLLITAAGEGPALEDLQAAGIGWMKRLPHSADVMVAAQMLIVFPPFLPAHSSNTEEDENGRLGCMLGVASHVSGRGGALCAAGVVASPLTHI